MKIITLQNLKKKYYTKNTIVVLGMHRSGTSLLSSVLMELGINMGSQMLGANHSNPMGHFEDLDFYTLNKKILRCAGGDWRDFPIREELEASITAHLDESEKLIKFKQFVNKKNAWGWKDPRTVLTHSLYTTHLKNKDTLYIFLWRNTDDIAKSLYRREGGELNSHKKLAEQYHKIMHAIYESIPSHAVYKIDFEDLYTNPEKTIRSLTSSVQIKNVFPTNDILKKSARVVRPIEEIRNKQETLKKLVNDRE